MIDLTNRVPDQETRHALPLVRTPAKGQLRVLVTTPDIIGTYTHWYAGRTQPCRGDTCKACLEGAPSRWLGYIAGRIADGPRHAIIELPQLAAEQISRHIADHGPIRGRILTLARLSKRANGRVSASIENDTDPDREIPPAPDMPRCLATLWQIKLADFSPGILTHAGRDIQVDQDSVANEQDPTHIKQVLDRFTQGVKPCQEPSAKRSSNSSGSASKAT